MVFSRVRSFSVGLLLLFTTHFTAMAEDRDWANSFFRPQMTIFMGIALGAQPQYPAVNVEISGSYTVLRAGAELQFGLIPPFLAAWGTFGAFAGLHLGVVDLDFEHFWSQSSIGPYRNQYGDALVLSVNGEDNLFQLYSIAPYKAKFSYIWNYWDSTMATLGRDEQVLDLKQPFSLAFGYFRQGDPSSAKSN